jgi:hypothetical protein
VEADSVWAEKVIIQTVRERHNAPMRRCVALVLIVLGTLFVGTGSAEGGWPSRSTPRGSTLGWFKATNAHDRQRLLFYVAPSARTQMSWAVPSRSWPKFTDLKCQSRGKTTSSNADLRCFFHASGAWAGNPYSFEDVYLHRFKRSWLIVSYGQG